MRILIADDDRFSSKLLGRVLENMGHEVVAAANGAEAWRMFQADGHRLIISDWMMPEMDGTELFRNIRARGCDSYVYLILLTGKNSREDRLAGLAAGADDFLTKPLDQAELSARIAAAERILGMQSELQSKSAELEALNHEIGRQMQVTSMANHRFSELFSGLPVACFTYDSDGLIHEWNRAAERLFGVSSMAAMEQPMELIACAQHERENIREVIQGVFEGKSFEALEYDAQSAEGHTIKLLTNTFPLRSQGGDVFGAISASIDITEQKALEEQLGSSLRTSQEMNAQLESQRADLEILTVRLGELATTDGLTSLCNHRHFRDHLNIEFELSSGSGDSLSVVLLDVDKFKQYNDSFGHPAGDEVLRRVAAALRGAARPGDLVARYGGEEFVVLLPATEASEACEVAENLRAALESGSWEHRDITASFGVATMTDEMSKPAELVDLADQALYRSKEAGRNRVTHAQEISGGGREAQAA